MSNDIHVAVAVLRDDAGRVLVAERPAWRHQGGGLEFPGGKLDPAESIVDALARELHEELGIRLLHQQPLMRIRHRYPDRNVVLHVSLADRWFGDPEGAEGQAVEWCAVEQLSPDRFPAANRPIIAALQWPTHYLITPAVEERELDSLIAGLERAIGQGRRLVQLRQPHWCAGAWARLLERACGIADRVPGTVQLIANTSDPAWLERFPGLAGIHLNARAMECFERRPVPANRFLSCACHDREEARRAEQLEADCLVVGHVKSTPTHADRKALGWEGLEQLSAESLLPIYAIGGMTEADLEHARHRGAIGIAAIRGFWPGS